MTDKSNTNEQRPVKPAEGSSTLPALMLRVGLPIGILVAGWAAYSFLAVQPERPKAPPAEKPPIRTKVADLRFTNYPVIVKTHAVVRPHNEITVSALVSGRITRISPEFEDGAFFSEGDVLVELDVDDYLTGILLAKARLLGARATLELARVNHERNLEFLDESLVPQAEVDLSSATLAQAEAEVDSASGQLGRAQRDLERTKVRAPFDGRVRQRAVGLGQSVGISTPLGVVFAVEYAEARLPIAARELPFLDLPESAEDEPVEVELRDGINEDSETVWNARIVRTEGALDPNSLELFAIARVDDPFGRKSGAPPLRIGQPVIGSIRGRVLTNVIALPRVAVRKLDQIYLVDMEAITLQTRTIDAIWSDEDHVIVQDSSLTDGYSLATTHLVYAPDNASVEIIPDIEPLSTATSSNITATASNVTTKVQASSKKES